MSDELVKQQRFEREAKHESWLEQQIAACKLLAPGNGLVVHGDGFPELEPGAGVTPRQLIARIYDLESPMRSTPRWPKRWSTKSSPGIRPT